MLFQIFSFIYYLTNMKLCIKFKHYRMYGYNVQPTIFFQKLVRFVYNMETNGTRVSTKPGRLSIVIAVDKQMNQLTIT